MHGRSFQSELETIIALQISAIGHDSKSAKLNSTWEHSFFWLAWKVPDHGSTGSGFLNLRTPTGGFAKGMPVKLEKLLPFTDLKIEQNFTFSIVKLDSQKGFLKSWESGKVEVNINQDYNIFVDQYLTLQSPSLFWKTIKTWSYNYGHWHIILNGNSSQLTKEKTDKSKKGHVFSTLYFNQNQMSCFKIRLTLI